MMCSLAGKWVQALEFGLGQRGLGATQGGSEGQWLCKPGNTHFPHSGATLPAFKIRLYTCLVWRPWAKQPKPLLPQVQTGSHIGTYLAGAVERITCSKIRKASSTVPETLCKAILINLLITARLVMGGKEQEKKYCDTIGGTLRAAKKSSLPLKCCPGSELCLAFSCP